MSSLAAARADNYYVPNNEPFNKNKKLLLLKKKKENEVLMMIRIMTRVSLYVLQCHTLVHV